MVLLNFNKLEIGMNRKEFFEWLETCPTHKWEVSWDSTEGEDGKLASGFIQVSFPTNEELGES